MTLREEVAGFVMGYRDDMEQCLLVADRILALAGAAALRLDNERLRGALKNVLDDFDLVFGPGACDGPEGSRTLARAALSTPPDGLLDEVVGKYRKCLPYLPPDLFDEISALLAKLGVAK